VDGERGIEETGLQKVGTVIANQWQISRTRVFFPVNQYFFIFIKFADGRGGVGNGSGEDVGNLGVYRHIDKLQITAGFFIIVAFFFRDFHSVGNRVMPVDNGHVARGEKRRGKKN